MTFNPSSINLEVLFDTKQKAEQFIKNFAEGYREILGSFPPSFKNARLINNSDPRKQYLGLKEIYQRVIIPKIEEKMRSKLEQDNLGLSTGNINLLFNKEKQENVEFLRKNLEFTRISGAYNVINTGEVESSLPSGYGLGKATCGNCGKEKKEGEKGWKLYEWKGGRIPKTYLCSETCLEQWKQNIRSGQFPNPNDSEKCDKCHNPLKGESYHDNHGGVFCAACVTTTCEKCKKRGIPTRGSGWRSSMGYDFCSQSCLNEWMEAESSSQNGYDLEQKRETFFDKVENLPGWELLTANERNNFRSQIYHAEPSQFAEIYQRVQQAIRSKKGETGDDSNSDFDHEYSPFFTSEYPASENQPDNSNEPTNDSNFPASNPPSTPKNSSAIDYQKVKTAPLSIARSLARAYIGDLFRNLGVKPEQLNSSLWKGFSDWESYLFSLNNSAEVANFLAAMEREIIKVKKKNSENSFWNRNKKTILITGGIMGAILIIGIAIYYYWTQKRKRVWY